MLIVSRWAGGAFMARDFSTVVIKDKSLLQGNRASDASSGGAAAMYHSSRTFVFGHTVFDGNSAEGNGKWLWPISSAAFLLWSLGFTPLVVICCRWGSCHIRLCAHLHDSGKNPQ
jgi:hypothetical protein